MSEERWIYHINRKTFEVTLKAFLVYSEDAREYSFATSADASEAALIAINQEIEKLENQLKAAYAALGNRTVAPK